MIKDIAVKSDGSFIVLREWEMYDDDCHAQYIKRDWCEIGTTWTGFGSELGELEKEILRLEAEVSQDTAKLEQFIKVKKVLLQLKKEKEAKPNE